MENEALANEILTSLQQMLEAAGPEWTVQYLQAGMQEAAQMGGGMEQQMMPQGGMGGMGGMGGGMGAMPPQGRTVGKPRGM
jgi:hypothetical protein